MLSLLNRFLLDRDVEHLRTKNVERRSLGSGPGEHHHPDHRTSDFGRRKEETDDSENKTICRVHKQTSGTSSRTQKEIRPCKILFLILLVNLNIKLNIFIN